MIDDGDEINRRRHSESRDGRSRVSHIGQPTIFSQVFAFGCIFTTVARGFITLLW